MAASATSSHTVDIVAVLEVDAGSGFGAGLDQLPVALAALRRRLVALAGALSADDWDRQSRCELWTVHDVLRHVRDVCRLHAGALRHPAVGAFDEPFDARRTPPRWLVSSAGDAPEDTLDQLCSLLAEEALALAARLSEPGQDPMVAGPYGNVHWTTLTAHVIWDRWLHVRDVTEALARSSPSSPVEDEVAALYALLLASMPAALNNHPFQATVLLAADGGRAYLATVRPRRASLRSARPDDAAGLRGPLATVVDSLAGRGPGIELVLDGDPAVVEPLAWLRPLLVPAPSRQEP